MDTNLLKSTLDAAAKQPDELVQFFYADLFARGGREVIEMFPPGMAAQRGKLAQALVQIVSMVDDLDTLSGYLAQLGRDHRKFDVQPHHYAVVGEALIAALAYAAGDAWSEEAAKTWAGAYALIAEVMQAGATEDAENPPWWEATVTSAERPSLDIAVLHARLNRPMNYQPGQSVAVQFGRLPRYWRFYSPATAPRDGHSLEFHVKVIDGGLMSTALALRAKAGDTLRVGPPVGTLQLNTSSGKDILMLAGSTGVAPLMAILEQLSGRPSPPDVRLFFGAREPDGLYALPALDRLAAQHAWLTVTPAVSATPGEAPGFRGEFGNVVDVATRAGAWHDRDAYVCGSSAMMETARRRLLALGMPSESVHVEDFGWEG